MKGKVLYRFASLGDFSSLKARARVLDKGRGVVGASGRNNLVSAKDFTKRCIVCLVNVCRNKPKIKLFRLQTRIRRCVIARWRCETSFVFLDYTQIRRQGKSSNFNVSSKSISRGFVKARRHFAKRFTIEFRTISTVKRPNGGVWHWKLD